MEQLCGILSIYVNIIGQSTLQYTGVDHLLLMHINLNVQQQQFCLVTNRGGVAHFNDFLLASIGRKGFCDSHMGECICHTCEMLLCPCMRQQGQIERVEHCVIISQSTVLLHTT